MIRMRRLRVNETMRRLVRETSVSVDDLLYPVFIEEGEDIKTPVESMPGIYKWSIDRFDEELARIVEAGIPGILIFGVPKKKDEFGSEAYNDNGITQRAIRYIKERAPRLLVVADVCLCEYTSHGHCGVVCDHDVANDETLPLLAKMAVSVAKAGADIIAPSDMMDGRVEYIREALDGEGFSNIAIMAYSAKFASAYYGPFREAADSAPAFGDRKTYQMDPPNGREAIRECENDIDEGADIIMVKPALAYLDVLKEMSFRTDHPLAVYNVSGEYAMVKAAAKKGWIDEKRIVMENMIAMKRAGARIVITYHALDVARWLKDDI
ncbi:MAG: porphobilinogen synthase [Lachnospiraceae bacterium]|nr:porphobilinogen synthase [Lachnospiraceae bacterium]